MSLPSVTPQPEPKPQTAVLLRGLGGGVVGGILGYLLFRFLISQGLYGLMIPGMALGIGAGAAARGRSPILGIVCVLLAIPLMIFAEWSVLPFRDDKSLIFFLTHLHELPTIKFLLIAFGAAGAYWFGQGR